MKFCETCFEKVKELDKHGDCKGCSTISERKALNLTAKPPQIMNEVWIDVPSKFKAYPASEGV